ncbi:uncharacterized protein METZ01_LOCUS403691, partial [marine metagenome]
PIHRWGEVPVHGGHVEWIRPFVFGHYRHGIDAAMDGSLLVSASAGDSLAKAPELRPDEYPDPLFDLAELIASLLLDIWIDPDPAIKEEGSGLVERGIDKKSGEYLLCNIWAKEKEPLKGYRCYREIFRSLELVMKWIDRIDDKESDIIGGREPTQKWFRYAIADRLIYRALLISSNPGCFEIGSEGKINTTEIALRIAQCIIKEETPPTAAEASAAYLREAKTKHIRHQKWASDSPGIDARGNKGTQVNTTIGEVKVNLGEIDIGGLHRWSSRTGKPEEDS